MLRTHSAEMQNAIGFGSGHKEAMFDWNDLRAFLAVAETGSTLAAARKLRVSQTTAARRIAALEEALGLALFDRRQAGYALTPAGETLLPRAREVEAAVGAFGDAVSAEARAVGGTVRLTTHEIYAMTLLPPILRELHDAHPAIRIELDSSVELRDLSAGTADVALRSTKSPQGGGLVGRRVGPDPWTVFCSRDYAARHGVPQNRAELRQHALIGGGGPGVGALYGAWLRKNELEDSVVMQHGSLTGLLASVRSGLGLAALPSFVARLDPDLIECLPPNRDDRIELWLLTHERLRHTPRIRIVLDFLYERLKRLAISQRSAEPTPEAKRA
jgi:DNA-binding transcriptional LysR family regulator